MHKQKLRTERAVERAAEEMAKRGGQDKLVFELHHTVVDDRSMPTERMGMGEVEGRERGGGKGVCVCERVETTVCY